MNIPKYSDEFRKELQRKGYRDNSIKNYVSCVERFLNCFIDRPQPKAINEYEFFLQLFHVEQLLLY